MALGYEPHPTQRKKPGTPTPFHHPPRPIPERSRTAPVSLPIAGSAPVSVPNASSYRSPPPPLPPPRDVDTRKTDLGWHMANREGSSGYSSRPIRAGSSLLGGGPPLRKGKPFSIPERNVDIICRHEAPTSSLSPSLPTRPQPSVPLSAPKSLLSAVKDRDEVVPASPPYLDLRGLMEYNKLHSEKPMSSDSLRRSSQTYDQQMLAKIGAPQPQNQQASPGASADEPMVDMKNTLSRLNGQLMNFGASVGTPPPGLRSPLSDTDHPLPSFPRRFSFKQQNPSQTSDKLRKDRLQTPGMAELSLQDRNIADDYQHTKTGQKRRANSPPPPPTNPSLSPSSQALAWEHSLQRGMMELTGARMPPPPRHQQASSGMSSVASSTIPQSYMSSNFSLSQPSTAATSYSDHFVPGMYQGTPESAPPQGSVSQYHAAQPSSPSHLAQNMGAPPIPQRKSGNHVLRVSGLWMCECCPKKPRKFDTEHDLRLHEMEKQYICQFCHNRFKNKNEAERHQNSLHLRKHSWSCSVLTSFEDAFHPTSASLLAAQLPPPDTTAGSEAQPQSYQALHSTATDTCGYCGKEFVNPPQWEDRVNHLNHVHKFGECNQTKKFFRADHFRQHLKHSHAGTSGKWTNELEKACMKDEPPPQPLPGMPPVHNAVPGGQPGIIMVGQQALLAQHQISENNRRAEEQAQQAQHQTQHTDGSSASSAANSTQRQQSQPYVGPNQQFPGIEQLQHYQPPPKQQTPSHQDPASASPEQAALSLAQHLQQAQREMSENMSKSSETHQPSTERMEED